VTEELTVTTEVLHDKHTARKLEKKENNTSEEKAFGNSWYKNTLIQLLVMHNAIRNQKEHLQIKLHTNFQVYIL